MCHGPATEVRGQPAAGDSLSPSTTWVPGIKPGANCLYLLSCIPALLLALVMLLALGLPRMLNSLLLVFMKTMAVLVVAVDGVSVGDGDAAGAH